MKIFLLETPTTGIKAVFRYSSDEYKSAHRIGVLYDDTKQWLFRADTPTLPFAEDELQQLTNEVRLLNSGSYPKPLPPAMLADRGFNPDYSVH